MRALQGASGQGAVSIEGNRVFGQAATPPVRPRADRVEADGTRWGFRQARAIEDLMNATRLHRWMDQMALALCAGACGVVLYLALFPAFYYMTVFAVMLLLWAIVPTIVLITGLITRLAQATPDGSSSESEASAPGNAAFIGAMLLIVTALVTLKVPLRASFLLAKPGFEEALAQHQDDLTQVGRVSHDFGLYSIGRAERRADIQDRIFFLFQNDSESAIIYSESGIENLCYNSGSKGHLFGNWYWMKED